MSIPNDVPVEGFAGKYRYRVLGKRPPKRGDYYLSGAIVQAWLARNDLTTEYIVVDLIGPLCKDITTWYAWHKNLI